MRIKPEQISSHLKRGLAPLYLVCGDEPLQMQEVCDVIRAAARQRGYGARELMHVGAGFDWNDLTRAACSLSLFAEQRLLELRIASGKPGDAGAAALLEYAARPPQDTMLLIICPKPDAATQKAKWFSAVEQAGAVVQVWPVSAAQLPAWIEGRLRARGMQPSREAVTMLAERVEGNLLAALQDIEKLYLLHGAGAISAQDVTSAVSDSARFDIYELVDSALAGQTARTTRILNGLHDEGVESTLVLWALARELRSLASLAYACEQGMAIESALSSHKVWEKRKPLVKQAVQRHQARHWQRLVQHAAQIDRMIKGVGTGNVWDELLQLSLALSGVFLLSSKRAGVNL